MKGNGAFNYRGSTKYLGVQAGGLEGEPVCFPDEDTGPQNVPEVNGNDPVKGRSTFGVWDTLFSCHLVYKHERLSTPAPSLFGCGKGDVFIGEKM